MNLGTCFISIASNASTMDRRVTISGEVEKESATAESLSADCNLIVTDDKLGSFSQLCRLQGGIQMHGMQICIMGLVIFIYLCMILMLPTIG